MRRGNAGFLSVFVGAMAMLAADRASAHIYIASATGHASDLSNPADGVGDAAGPAGDFINMILNQSDANPQAIMDRRGVFEIDGSTIRDHFTNGAFLQFDVFGANSPFPVDIYLYAGDGVVGSDDYSRTENLAFSGILVDDTPLIDVTSEVDALLDGNQTWIGVLIAMTHEDQTLVIDNVDGHGIDPSITTKAVPEPSTLLLFGLLGLGIARRRPA